MPQSRAEARCGTGRSATAQHTDHDIHEYPGYMIYIGCAFLDMRALHAAAVCIVWAALSYAAGVHTAVVVYGHLALQTVWRD